MITNRSLPEIQPITTTPRDQDQERNLLPCLHATLFGLLQSDAARAVDADDVRQPRVFVAIADSSS